MDSCKLNCLCSSFYYFSANRVWNIQDYHIQDFGPCDNINSHVCRDGFGHFKEQLNCQARIVLRKKLFVILYSAVQKLCKFSILLLLIINHTYVYLSIYLLILSISWR